MDALMLMGSPGNTKFPPNVHSTQPSPLRPKFGARMVGGRSESFESSASEGSGIVQGLVREEVGRVLDEVEEA